MSYSWVSGRAASAIFQPSVRNEREGRSSEVFGEGEGEQTGVTAQTDQAQLTKQDAGSSPPTPPSHPHLSGKDNETPQQPASRITASEQPHFSTLASGPIRRRTPARSVAQQIGASPGPRMTGFPSVHHLGHI